MKRYLLLLVLLMSVSCSKKPSPTDALERLMQGNARYVNSKSVHPNRSQERREELTDGQSPYAVIVSCSDSRVCPAVIFDQGLGDLFVIRVAGNVVGPLEMESLGYAASVLSPSLVLVVGHQNCGAVGAVYDGADASIPITARLIKPAIQNAPSLEAAIKENAIHTKNIVKKYIDIPVRAAYYDLNTGHVQLLPE